MGWKDTERLMISVTYFLYVNSAIPTYIETALLMVNDYRMGVLEIYSTIAII